MQSRFDLFSLLDRYPALFAGGLVLHTLVVVILLLSVVRP
jgi:hypothetical protein